jgi:hypothetical protein
MNTRLLLSIALVAGFATAAHAQLFRMGATRNLSSVSNIVANGYLSLSGVTNRLTVADGALKLDGGAVGGATIGDPFVVTSELADNATNVAMVVDTDEAWATSGSRFLSVRNNGVEQFSVGRRGGLTVGANTADANNGLAEATYTLLSIHNVSAGDADINSALIMTDMDGQGDGNYGEFNLVTLTNQASLILGVTREWSGSTYHDFSARDDTVDGYHRIYVNGTLRMGLHPSAADGNPAYNLGTSVSHASGNLATVSNNGTNKFAVDYKGALITQGGDALTPANASASGQAGEIRWDASFIYICVAANTWKRVAIATW